MKALEGVRILDMTHVQSGPTCTQLLAWFGADVIKVERPGTGDPTRGQLRDIPEVDSLYFTMLNHNKRSITLNTKHERGKAIFTRLIEVCDVLAENAQYRGQITRAGANMQHLGAGPYIADCQYLPDSVLWWNTAPCNQALLMVLYKILPIDLRQRGFNTAGD